MSTPNPHTLSYAELDMLSGELLPGRLLLSAAGRGGDLDAVYACQVTHSAGTSGVLDTGLLAQPETTTVACFPVVVQQSS